MQVSPDVLHEGCKRFGADPAVTHPRPGEETANYFSELNGTAVMLRFAPIPAVNPKAEARFAARYDFATFIAAGGAGVARPVRSKDGNLIEWITDPAHRSRWALVAVEWIDGGPIEAHRLNQYASSVIRAWGALMGRMHALTKSFPATDAVYGWDEESTHFMNTCGDPGVAEKWKGMRAHLAGLSRDVDSYGFVHNDLHSMNVIAAGDRVTAIDFDDACYHWFACDIAIAMQAVLWSAPDGVETNMPRWRQIYRAFMNGYREENDLDSHWEDEIPAFLAYRRLLLYSVFANVWKRPGAWQKDRLTVWKRGILTDTPVIGPVSYTPAS